ncbi:MAG: exosortase/archaeosortase family protein [Verrucomicrobiota bacterium]|nr:exosortase/archaeosortase family protein [Verrucomicrobiota bacterium]
MSDQSKWSAEAKLAVFAGLLSLLFCRPLTDLVAYAAKSSMYSHTLLIPVISLYLARQRLRRAGVSEAGVPEFRGIGQWRAGGGWLGAGLLGLVAIVVLVFYFGLKGRGTVLARDDYLFLTLLPYVCFLAAGGFVFLGARSMRVLVFPWVFLVFMVPFPVAVMDAVETFLQYASAEASHLLFAIGGTPYLRDGLRFDLPGISIEVARECSGIRSSLVLFITSLLAGDMFLRSGWKRAVLALAVVPLGILRNGFRVFTIGMLSANVDAGIIDSALHRRGGPIFFVLSLIPFLGLLWWLRWLERPTRATSGEA